MFRKLNTKTLMIALVGLLAVVVSVYLLDLSKGERTFKESLVQTNSETIDKIQLLPKSAEQKRIEFEKNGGNWTVSQNDKGYPADNSAIMDLINLKCPQTGR